MCVCTVGGWAQDVTLDFSNSGWGLPSNYVTGSKSYTCDGYTVTFGNSSNGHKKSGNGVIMGKEDATLSLPAFDFDVEKIVLVRNSGTVSGKVTFNIYVGSTAVSTQVTGCGSNQTFNIKDGYQSAGNIYTIKVTNGNNLQISKIEIYKKASSGTTKNKPTVSFTGLTGEGVTLTEGKLADNSDFTGYTATATYASNTVAGDFAYTASGDGVATVDETTGAVTVNPTVYGTTTVTATFTPTDGENYATATASYTIKNNQKVDESAIVFDCSTYDKKLLGSSYTQNATDIELSSVAGKNYTFKFTACMASTSTSIPGTIQMQAKNGIIKSPTFDAFENGYKLVVTYGGSNIPTVSSDELTDAKAVTDETKKTVTIELPSSTATFTIKATGTGAKYISKMELTALAPTNPKPEISFAETSQTVELKDEYATVQTLTKPTDLADADITYSSSDNEIAEVEGKDIYLYKAGTVTITATSAATDVYSSATATYTLNIVDSRADAGVSVKESEVIVDVRKKSYDLASNINNANGVTLTYTSNNANFKVENNTLNFENEGTATITASFAGNDTYKPAIVQYTLTVADTRTTDADFKFAESTYTVALNDGICSFDAKTALQNPNKLNVTYTISPESDDATIGETEGDAVVMLRGTYTITATGISDDYLETTATCTLVVKDNSVEEKTVEFKVGADKGTKTVNNNSDEMFKNPVTIFSTEAALGRSDEYRFYGQGITTISTRMGTIKAIEFISKSPTGKNTTKDFKLVDGEPGEFTATTKSAVWSGPAKEVKIRNNSGSQIQVSSIKVTVEIPVAKSYTLDQTSESNTLEDYDNANVTINRTIGTDGWYTLCLPFSLTESETKTYFGDDVNIRTFDSMNETVMNFKKVTAMEAGKPYLVKTSTGFDGTTTPFEGVQLKAADPDQTSGADGYKMQGIYNKTKLAIDGSQLFLGDNNKFFKPSTAGNTMKGFRVYFEVPMENGVPMNLSAANIDGVETALTRIDGETVNNDTRVFNLQGQCLGTSLSNLPSGIYVQGGKKVVVK